MRKAIRSAFWEKTGAKLLSVLSALLLSLPAWSPQEFASWLAQALPGVPVPTWAFSVAGLTLAAVRMALAVRGVQRG